MKPKHQKKQPYKNASSSIALTIKLNKYASVWSKLCVLLLKRESGEALRAFFHWLDRSIALNLQKAPRTAHLNSHKHTARSFQNCTDSGRSKIAPLWLIQRDFFILTQSCPFSKSGSEPTLNRNVFTRRIYFTLFYISFFVFYFALKIFLKMKAFSGMTRRMFSYLKKSMFGSFDWKHQFFTCATHSCVNVSVLFAG